MPFPAASPTASMSAVRALDEVVIVAATASLDITAAAQSSVGCTGTRCGSRCAWITPASRSSRASAPCELASRRSVAFSSETAR
jgi:hypothetical protein